MAADAVLIMGLNNRPRILPSDLGSQSQECLPKTKPLPVGAEGVLLQGGETVQKQPNTFLVDGKVVRCQTDLCRLWK